MSCHNENFPSVAVVGCGYWGKNLVRNFHDLHALSAICESDKDVPDYALAVGTPAKIKDWMCEYGVGDRI